MLIAHKMHNFPPLQSMFTNSRIFPNLSSVLTINILEKKKKMACQSIKHCEHENITN